MRGNLLWLTLYSFGSTGSKRPPPPIRVGRAFLCIHITIEVIGSKESTALRGTRTAATIRMAKVGPSNTLGPALTELTRDRTEALSSTSQARHHSRKVSNKLKRLTWTSQQPALRILSESDSIALVEPLVRQPREEIGSKGNSGRKDRFLSGSKKKRLVQDEKDRFRASLHIRDARAQKTHFEHSRRRVSGLGSSLPPQKGGWGGGSAPEMPRPSGRNTKGRFNAYLLLSLSGFFIGGGR